MSALRRPRILLARRDQVTVAEKLTGLAPRRLTEVRRDDVAHFEEIADVHVFSRNLTPHGDILRPIESYNPRRAGTSWPVRASCTSMWSDAVGAGGFAVPRRVMRMSHNAMPPRAATAMSVFRMPRPASRARSSVTVAWRNAPPDS